MSDPHQSSGRHFIYAIVAILVSGLVIAAAIFATMSRPPAVTTTEKSTIILISTITPVVTIAVAPKALSNYRTNGDWNFSVSLSATLVTQGENIQVVLNTTNISGQTQRVDAVNPLYNPTIYSDNGTLVWALDPSQINYVANWPSTQANTSELSIPTSELAPGQNYVLSLWPLIGTPTGAGQDLIGENLMINVTIGIE